MNQNRSVATIDAPEFINLKEDALNPGISQCEVKVFYLGKNRNGSFINKNTAIQMANSLPGTPIVGAYRKDIEDFGDHGQVIHIENGEVQFSCSTIPYGFVAPDARCWFKKFEETDEFGESVIREYLMTTGYLWTGQYPELESCIEEGKGQSMELDPDKIDGHWASSNNDGIEFFIINDAIFSKLCILGDDVEPCFEGAAVTSPEVSANFVSNPEFSQTLYTMMNELIFALKNNKGGSDMPEDTINQEEIVEEEEVEEVEAPETDESVEGDADETEESEESEDADTDFACGNRKKKEFANDDDKDDEEEEEEETPAEEDSDDNDEKSSSDDEKDKKKPSSNHSVEKYEQLKAELDSLKEEIGALREFKLSQENAEKEALFNKYFMLSEEEKAPIFEQKAEFTCEQIEEKLALLYVRKNVNFESVDGSFQEEEEVIEDDPALSFSLDNSSSGFVPPVVEALRRANHR